MNIYIGALNCTTSEIVTKQSRSFALPFYFPSLSGKRLGRGQTLGHNFFIHFKIYFREWKSCSLKTTSPHPVGN